MKTENAIRRRLKLVSDFLKQDEGYFIDNDIRYDCTIVNDISVLVRLYYRGRYVNFWNFPVDMKPSEIRKQLCHLVSDNVVLIRFFEKNPHLLD